uniref:Uncharacterized protein n=1 Tax=Coturnix japonica TaxID=93934 RepID=A0A8C2U0S2_COTJA
MIPVCRVTLCHANSPRGKPHPRRVRGWCVAHPGLCICPRVSVPASALLTPSTAHGWGSSPARGLHLLPPTEAVLLNAAAWT